MKSFAFAVAALLSSPIATAAIFCVDDSATLTQAIASAASNGQPDAIRVRDGTYTAPIGGWLYYPSAVDRFENISLSGGWQAGCGSQLLDSSLTKLSGANARRILAFSRGQGNTSSLEISGLSLINAFSSGEDFIDNQGLALRIWGSNHTGPMRIENVIVRDNSALHGNDVVHVEYGGSLHFRNNLIVNNQAGDATFGVYLAGDGDGYISHNTIANNTVLTTPSVVLGLDLTDSTGARYVSNNVIWGNAYGLQKRDFTASNLTLLTNNDIGVTSGVPAAGSIGNVSIAPAFVSATDFRLQAGSPLHNLGNNTPFGGLPPYDLTGQSRIQNGVTDLGAYETPSSAIFKNSFD